MSHLGMETTLWPVCLPPIPHAPMTPAIHPLGFLIKGSETLAKGYHIVP